MYGFRFASIVLLATAVLADNLPACAQSCVTNYNGCSQFDVACICGSSAWISGLACCVSKVCSASDQQATINFANTICAGVGITNLPQTASCSAGASSFSTGAATIYATAGGEPSSGASTATSSVSSTAASSTVASSSIASTTAAAAAASSSTSTTNAGNMNTAGSFGLGALLAGLVVIA